MLLSKRRRLLVVLVLAASIGAASGLALYFDLFHTLQQQTSDLSFQAANAYLESETEDRIAIVGVDDKSLDKLGRFAEWPRSHYARLIDNLVKAEARVIVIDVLFAEPAPGDEELAASIRNAGNIVLPVLSQTTAGNPVAIPEANQPRSFLRSLPVFEKAALAVGHANIAPDSDGVVRRLAISIGNGDSAEPALALAAVARYLRRPEAAASVPGSVSFAGRLIPVNSGNEVIINYVGGRRGTGGIVRFPTVSFLDVMQGDFAPALFRDKLVVVGATASGLGDVRWTPIGQMLNGVEIHASAINTLLTGNFLRRAPAIVTIASILLMALLCGLAVWRFRALWSALSAVLLCVLYLIIAFSFFDLGFMLNMLYPPFALGITFVAMNVYQVVSERAEKREITRVFGRYVSPSVVDQTLAALSSGELELGGEEHEITAVFFDVRGFAGISELVPPGELVRALNDYLSVIIEAVLRYNGIINKFAGDSVMAIWNVPVACNEHPLLAVKAAVGAQRALGKLQGKHSAAIMPVMEFGIGINTGRAVAGNIGSADRLEYSVVGDAVNTAARLASVTPGGKIWVGHDTYFKVKDYVIAQAIQPLEVKGKQKPVEAYEVIDIRDWHNGNGIPRVDLPTKKSGAQKEA